MNKIYAIGDLHLSFDPRVDKPQDKFGEDWNNHAEKLKIYWDSVVDDNDVVIIAGDISWALQPIEAVEDLKFIASLKGTKLIFKGNHDLWWPTQSKIRKLFNDPKVFFMKNNSYLMEMEGKRIVIAGTRGWKCPGDKDFTEHDLTMYNREVLRLRMSLDDAMKYKPDEIIGVLHYPPTNDSKQVSEFTKTLSEYGVKTCVYGHIHGKDNFIKGLKGNLNGVNYNLVSFDYLKGQLLEVR